MQVGTIHALLVTGEKADLVLGISAGAVSAVALGEILKIAPETGQLLLLFKDELAGSSGRSSASMANEQPPLELGANCLAKAFKRRPPVLHLNNAASKNRLRCNAYEHEKPQ